MSFTRTISGLSNLALFYNVDFIVFTEGGCNSYTFDNILGGSYNEKSIDIRFWNAVFKKHNFNKKIQFRALGSKTASKKVCELIENNDVRNIIVTKDSDLDDFTNSKFNSPFILYTQGYSWENDVYVSGLVKEQIKSYLLTDNLASDICTEIDDLYSEFERHSNRLLRIELIFRQNAIKLITNSCGERFIEMRSEPKIKIDQIQLLISELKGNIPKPRNVNCSNRHLFNPRFTYGKLVESFAISVISFVCRKLTSIKTFPKDLIVGSMIERYGNRYDHQDDNYYKNLIGQLQT